jgi:hypothetical protein
VCEPKSAITPLQYLPVKADISAGSGLLCLLQLLPVHQTLRVTPAMEAGLEDHVWTLGELVGLLESRPLTSSEAA